MENRNLSSDDARLIRQHFVPFADYGAYNTQFKKLALAFHPDRGGDAVIMQKINILNEKMSLQNHDDFKRISDTVFADQQQHGEEEEDGEDSPPQNQPFAALGGLVFRKPDRVRCYNCRGYHIAAQCKINRCIFCWDNMNGRYHTCNRKWTLLIYNRVNDYRRQVTSRVQRYGFPSPQVTNFCDQEWRAYMNLLKNEPPDCCVICTMPVTSPYLCRSCKNCVGCFNCCQQWYEKSYSCPLCGSQSW